MSRLHSSKGIPINVHCVFQRTHGSVVMMNGLEAVTAHEAGCCREASELGQQGECCFRRRRKVVVFFPRETLPNLCEPHGSHSCKICCNRSSNLTINSKYHHALRVYVSPSAACAAPLRSNYGSVLLWLFAGAHRARDREATRSGADAMQGPSVGEPVSLMSLITRWE
ncbi:hypothetical protein F2P81_015011 [Scophthalmus maximus]|uniref:Uncharacterized protein n=1 Tax=Scophthalmus maximus TaxID=52904 RepID=A0A6A4SNR5_SCOMX|nr:hypothetical protein F2P81_015011 [Scophthalmus maximus]